MPRLILVAVCVIVVVLIAPKILLWIRYYWEWAKEQYRDSKN